MEILRQLVVRPAVNARAPSPVAAAAPAPAANAPRPRRSWRLSERLVRPIFIVNPPRSGTSLLFETLARAPEL